MIHGILTGFLSTILLASTTAFHYTAPAQQLTKLETNQTSVNTVIWVVKPNESLKSIAKDYFGSEDFWTTIWNYNDTIKDPDIISVDTVLTLPQETDGQPEDLKKELADLLDQKQQVDAQYNQPVVQAAAFDAPTSTPTPTTSTPVYTGGPLNSSQIDFLGHCEAGMNPTRNSGNGYYGAFQFSYGTWSRLNTGYERADLAPLDVQIAAVQQLLSRSSIYTQFPACARKMAAAGLL